MGVEYRSKSRIKGLEIVLLLENESNFAFGSRFFRLFVFE